MVFRRGTAGTSVSTNATYFSRGSLPFAASLRRFPLPLPFAASLRRSPQLDLTDPESISTFTSKMKKLPKLDVLVLNAGMMYGPDFTGPFQTSNFPGGTVDTMIASNHLGSFNVLHDLLSTLETHGTRVVFVSSISHHLGTPDLLASTADPLLATEGSSLSPSQSVGAFALYGNTKLFNVLTANKLSRLLPSNPVTVVTPGFCATTIGSTDRSPGLFNPLEYVPLTFSAKQGGDLLVAATQIEPVFGKMLQPYWIWESGENEICSGTICSVVAAEGRRKGHLHFSTPLS